MMDNGIHQEFSADVLKLFPGQFPFENVKLGGFYRFDAFDIQVAQTD